MYRGNSRYDGDRLKATNTSVKMHTHTDTGQMPTNRRRKLKSGSYLPSTTRITTHHKRPDNITHTWAQRPHRLKDERNSQHVIIIRIDII